MHFMDLYNYDVERVRRCVIHYAAPDGKIYPFCAYNSGPTFREKIERQFALSEDEILDKAEKEGHPRELEKLVKRIRDRKKEGVTSPTA